MAIPKVIGTETEYGISAVGSPEFNPVISSSLLISTYAGALRRIRWDYEQESPLRDARGFEPVQLREPSEEDLGLANVILPWRESQGQSAWNDYNTLPARLTNRRIETGALRLF